MLGVYNYTVILTYFGMLISFTGIFFTTHGDHYGTHRPGEAIWHPD